MDDIRGRIEDNDHGYILIVVVMQDTRPVIKDINVSYYQTLLLTTLFYRKKSL